MDARSDQLRAFVFGRQAGDVCMDGQSVASALFFRKASLENLLPDLQPGKRERHGPCPFCGGTDRFIAFLASGRGYCRQCGWKGDSIALLMDRDHLSFREAVQRLGLDALRPPTVKRPAKIYPLAQGSKSLASFFALMNEYNDLITECDIVAIACRAIDRQPHFYSDEEWLFWKKRREKLSDRLGRLKPKILSMIAGFAQGGTCHA